MNFDDERVKNLAEFSKAETISYGFSEGAKRAYPISKRLFRGKHLIFLFRGKQESVEIKKYGRHNVYAWMIAKIVKEII